MKRFTILLTFLFLFCISLSSQTMNTYTVDVAPYGTFPLGSSTELYEMGYGIRAVGSFEPGRFKYFGLGLSSDYSILPLSGSDHVWILSGDIGPILKLSLGKSFDLHAAAMLGYHYASALGWDADDLNGAGLTLRIGSGGSFTLSEKISIGLRASYDYYENVYNGFSVNLFGRINYKKEAPERTLKEYSPENGNGVELLEMDFTSLFPVLYKYYDSNSIGTLRVVNNESRIAEEIRIKFFADRYMDYPMDAGEPFSLEPGEERKIDLYGLFTEEMMSITEGTKASAQVSVEYKMKNRRNTTNYTAVLDVYNRNALVWDDNIKIASFITAKDPVVLSFSRNISSWITDLENPAIDENLQKAMLLFEALKAYGMSYQIDPSTPYSNVSSNAEIIDFIQFPRQTLDFTSGDCDDLTALYSALLEAVGVETAIITVPGHIYMAFSLMDTPTDAKMRYSAIENYIIQNEKVWVPIEITMFQKSFEQAWVYGAKQWREHSLKEQAQFYPTRENWEHYQAVGFSENSREVELPERQLVTKTFSESLGRFIGQEIYMQEALLLERIDNSNESHKYQNKLAVLYARNGLYDKALEIFENINSKQTYLPAMVNIGNLLYLLKDLTGALDMYDKVLDVDPEIAVALLGSARCNHEMENYGIVKKRFVKLQSVNPTLAQRFNYLDLRGDESQRAIDATGLSNLVIWEEEE